MRSGVIDIGSNSIKLLIGEKANGDIKILDSLKNVIPIGKQTFFKERISQEIINRMEDCFYKLAAAPYKY